MAMPSQSAHQNLFERSAISSRSPSFSHLRSWTSTPIRNTSLAAGRKRSRDEAAVNLDPPEKLVEAPIIKEAEDEWEYGPGMTLIKKKSGYVADASSQSGTWVEEKAAEARARQAEALLQQLSQQRPSLRSNKSQRLETPGVSRTTSTQNGQVSPTRDLANPVSATLDSNGQPVVDNFTLHLGIGWRRIDDDEDIQAAARGWARYIENHYPISNATIRLQSRALESYLVEASEGFFLFSENLRQGRLVSHDAERAIQNLKTSPPTFDGLDTMEASETPTSTTTTNTVVEYFASTTPGTATHEMDMS